MKIYELRTKKELIEALLENGIVKVQVLRVPDWNGGCRPRCVLLKEGDAEYGYGEHDRKLGDFTYVEFSGDTSKAVAHLGDEFWEHYEARYCKPRDYYPTLRALITSALADL